MENEFLHFTFIQETHRRLKILTNLFKVTNRRMLKKQTRLDSLLGNEPLNIRQSTILLLRKNSLRLRCHQIQHRPFTRRRRRLILNGLRLQFLHSWNRSTPFTAYSPRTTLIRTNQRRKRRRRNKFIHRCLLLLILRCCGCRWWRYITFRE